MQPPLLPVLICRLSLVVCLLEGLCESFDFGWVCVADDEESQAVRLPGFDGEGGGLGKSRQRQHQRQEQLQRQHQIPFGDDNQKDRQQQRLTLGVRPMTSVGCLGRSARHRRSGDNGTSLSWSPRRSSRAAPVAKHRRWLVRHRPEPGRSRQSRGDPFHRAPRSRCAS